jgi:alkylation response protein AidB-like acyl-CoA dehydrogenase
VEEIARVLPSLAVDFVLAGMAMRMLAHPTSGPAAAELPAIAEGERLIAFALSEPGAGTDLLALRTSARQDGQDWVINGQKLWISLADEAEILYVLARTDPIENGHRARGLSVLAVPADQPGVTIERIGMSGMRAAISCEVSFDDARADKDALVGERGRGLRLLSETLDVERVMSAGISLGIGRGALDLHITYAQEREAFGAPIGALQAVQHPIADSVTDLSAARALTAVAVRAIEAGDADAAALSAMSKMAAAEATARIVDRGMRAMGAMGLAEETPMQMYFRDARLQLFSPISNEMVRNVLGESLGLPRSY